MTLKENIDNASILISISDKEFNLLSELIYQKTGIFLQQHKKSLIVSRLNKIVKDLKFNNFHDYYEYVINDPSGEALVSMVDKISTNHTFFFREKEHFDFLKEQVFPELFPVSKKDKKIRVWSAGCSTGEEVFSIAFLLSEYLGTAINQWDIGLLATDISMTALVKARESVYSQDRVNALPAEMIKKYFQKTENAEFKVKEEIKKMVLFKKLNFMDEKFPFKGKFHIIFCRNVMIYFDKETSLKLIDKFYHSLYPGGYLMIGHSENIARYHHSFQYIKPAVYKKEASHES